MIGIAAWKIWKWDIGVLLGYVFLVLCSTVLIRHPFSGQHFQPELFWSWRAWDRQKEQIIANVIMFIPVGVLTGRRIGWKGLWIATGLSVVIEVLQLVSSRGLCEFDDVMHNMNGASIGVGVLWQPPNSLREIDDRRRVESRRENAGSGHYGSYCPVRYRLCYWKACYDEI